MWTLLAFLSGQELVLELESFLVDQHLKRSLLPWIDLISKEKIVFKDNFVISLMKVQDFLMSGRVLKK